MLIAKMSVRSTLLMRISQIPQTALNTVLKAALGTEEGLWAERWFVSLQVSIFWVNLTTVLVMMAMTC
jgi:hypothetical protein